MPFLKSLFRRLLGVSSDPPAAPDLSQIEIETAPDRYTINVTVTIEVEKGDPSTIDQRIHDALQYALHDTLSTTGRQTYAVGPDGQLVTYNLASETPQ